MLNNTLVYVFLNPQQKHTFKCVKCRVSDKINEYFKTGIVRTLYFFKIFTNMNGKYGIFNHNIMRPIVYILYIYITLRKVWPYHNAEYSQYWLNDKTGQVKFFLLLINTKEKYSMQLYRSSLPTLTHAYTADTQFPLHCSNM